MNINYHVKCNIIHLPFMSQCLKAPIHFMSRSYDLISCYWGDLNLMSASDSHESDMNQAFAMSFVLRASYGQWNHVSHMTYTFVLAFKNFQLWPIKPRLPFRHSTLHVFFAWSLTSSNKCWWYISSLFFLLGLAENIMLPVLQHFHPC